MNHTSFAFTASQIPLAKVTRHRGTSFSAKNTQNGDQRYFIKIETPTVYKHYETMLENVTNVQTNILMYSWIRACFYKQKTSFEHWNRRVSCSPFYFALKVHSTNWLRSALLHFAHFLHSLHSQTCSMLTYLMSGLKSMKMCSTDRLTDGQSGV